MYAVPHETISEMPTTTLSKIASVCLIVPWIHLFRRIAVSELLHRGLDRASSGPRAVRAFDPLARRAPEFGTPVQGGRGCDVVRLWPADTFRAIGDSWPFRS